MASFDRSSDSGQLVLLSRGSDAEKSRRGVQIFTAMISARVLALEGRMLGIKKCACMSFVNRIRFWPGYIR